MAKPQILSDVARPHLAPGEPLQDGYAHMAADGAREREARQWSEGTIHDAYETKTR